jgi:phosphocarrier protein
MLLADILPVVEQTFEIRNTLGLHARAATKFVQTANRFDAEVEVEKDGQTVNGKSIMGVLMLVACKGSQITVRARGRQAAAALAALGELIRGKFGED